MLCASDACNAVHMVDMVGSLEARQQGFLDTHQNHSRTTAYGVQTVQYGIQIYSYIYMELRVFYKFPLYSTNATYLQKKALFVITLIKQDISCAKLVVSL